MSVILIFSMGASLGVLTNEVPQNEHRIRPVVSQRFAQLFMVEGTDTAFWTLDEAKAFAATVSS